MVNESLVSESEKANIRTIPSVVAVTGGTIDGEEALIITVTANSPLSARDFGYEIEGVPVVIERETSPPPQ